MAGSGRQPSSRLLESEGAKGTDRGPAVAQRALSSIQLGLLERDRAAHKPMREQAASPTSCMVKLCCKSAGDYTSEAGIFGSGVPIDGPLEGHRLWNITLLTP